MLLDSNIIICAAKPEHTDLERFIIEHAPAVSVISMVKVLGYHRLSEKDRDHFEEFFAAATVLPLSSAAVDGAVKLRQTKKMAWATRSLLPLPWLITGHSLPGILVSSSGSTG